MHQRFDIKHYLPGCDGWVAVRWAEFRSEPLGDVAEVVVREFATLATSVRARFDLERRSPEETAAADSAACRSRRLAAGTQVLFKWVLHSKPRLLQHVRHRWYEQSFFAWFPHSWHAVDPVPVTTVPVPPATTNCCCPPISLAFPPPAPHSSSACGSWYNPRPPTEIHNQTWIPFVDIKSA